MTHESFQHAKGRDQRLPAYNVGSVSFEVDFISMLLEEDALGLSGDVGDEVAVIAKLCACIPASGDVNEQSAR